jgi:hypothetical protein
MDSTFHMYDFMDNNYLKNNVLCNYYFFNTFYEFA